MMLSYRALSSAAAARAGDQTHCASGQQSCSSSRRTPAPAAAARTTCRGLALEPARTAACRALPPPPARGGSPSAEGPAHTVRRLAAAALATGLLLLQDGSGAAAAGLFGGGDQGAPEPFTLYGSNFKMYSIEKLDGEKVVSRTRGFTVDTCISAVDEAAETPEMQGLAAGERVRSGNNLLCKRSTGPDLRPACSSSCKEACSAALDAEAAKQQADTGLQLSPTDRKRLQRSCTRQCDYGCVGSGKSHDFVTPSRR